MSSLGSKRALITCRSRTFLAAAVAFDSRLLTGGFEAKNSPFLLMIFEDLLAQRWAISRAYGGGGGRRSPCRLRHRTGSKSSDRAFLDLDVELGLEPLG